MRHNPNLFLFLFLLVIGISPACTVVRGGGDDGKLSATIIQINDVYEIAPLNQGKEGGIARVATLKKNHLAKNPNSYLVMAGDFLSPSIFNSMQHEGKPIRGRQMVEALNAAGLDYTIFGNHEFDIREGELQSRIDESDFTWISSNALQKSNHTISPFKQRGEYLPFTKIIRMKDADGTEARIGLFGVLLPFNQVGYVQYNDALATSKIMYNQLKDSVDAVIAITHQNMEDDEKMAREIPGLAAIIGGHEHDERFARVGNVYITKAMANARSAYVLQLNINKRKKKTEVKPELVQVNETIALDSATNEVVKKWTRIAEANYASLGFDANRVVMASGDPLDGHETSVRAGSTNLTRLVTAAMKWAAPKADVVLLNGGSIRVDDFVNPPVTEYDILRTLPFGGSIVQADVKGSLITEALTTGSMNKGSGGFLHANEGVSQDATGTWLLNGQPILPQQTYRLAMAEFLFTGRESKLDFLSPKDPRVVKVYDEEKSSPLLADIRMAVVKYLQQLQ